MEDLKAKDEQRSEELSRKEEKIKMLQDKIVLLTKVNHTQSEHSSSHLDAVVNGSLSTEVDEKVNNHQESLVKKMFTSFDSIKYFKLIKFCLQVLKDGEMNRLQRQLDQVKASLDTMTQNWQNEKAMNMSLQDKLTHMSEEKNGFVVRNAELKQQFSLSQQQLQRTEKEMKEFQTKAIKMEQEAERCKHLLSDAEARDENSERVTSLRSQVTELEAAVAEKNKTMKLQQQRLADMKKTLQKELKNQGANELGDNLSPLSAGPSPAANRKAPPSSSSSAAPGKSDLEEVNFKYLKHVIFKFLTSREYEVRHCID